MTPQRKQVLHQTLLGRKTLNKIKMKQTDVVFLAEPVVDWVGFGL